MTPARFRAVLAQLGMSQLACARFLGVAPRTVRRWITGDARIPVPTAMLLEGMASGKIKPRDFTKLPREEKK